MNYVGYVKHMRDITALETKYEELGKEIAALKVANKDRIDLSKLPKGTRVMCRIEGSDGTYIRVISDTTKGFTCTSSLIQADGSIYGQGRYAHIRLVKGDVMPWIGGGECPLPEGVKVRYWLRDTPQGCTGAVDYAHNLSWIWKDEEQDIIAYQIQVSEWQEA